MENSRSLATDRRPGRRVQLALADIDNAGPDDRRCHGGRSRGRLRRRRCGGGGARSALAGRVRGRAEAVLAVRRQGVPDARLLRRHPPPHRQLGRRLHGGDRLSPEQAYRFARGEEVVSSTGVPVRLSRPMDFLVVSDHAEGLGVMYQVYDGNPAFMADPTLARWGKAMKAGGREAGERPMNEVISAQAQGTLPAPDQGPEDRRSRSSSPSGSSTRRQPRSSTSRAASPR